MRLPLEDSQKLPEDKVLNAEITSVKRVEKPWIDDRTGENAVRLAFEFTFLDEEIAGRKHWEDLFTSFYPGDRCRLYQWTLRLLNREELPEEFVLDTDAFEGMKVPVMLNTNHFTIKKGPNAGKPGSALNLEILSQQEAAGLRAGGGTSGGTGGAPTTAEPIKPLEDSSASTGDVKPMQDPYDEVEPF